MGDHWSKIFILMLFVTITQVYGQNEVVMVNATFITDAVAKGAVCLDGSPAAYHYHMGSGKGANNWMVYLQGGGWCGSKKGCLSRAVSELGSTKNITSTSFSAILSPNQNVNPDFYNWNKVYMRYCDGASFMADVDKVDPETNLHLRGGRIFTAAMEELLAKGMKNANNAVLVGNSAGGLATILNCDRFHSFLPNARSVKCISDSGFFLRAKDLPGAEGREGSYASITAFHGLSKTLPTSCTSKMNASLCLFPENVVGDIQTPLFLLNTAFDSYQIFAMLRPRPEDEAGWQSCTRDLKTCTNNQLQTIKDFRTTFLKTVKEIPDNPTRGMFINSCFIHDFLYKKLNWLVAPKIEKKTIGKAIGDWYFDRSTVRLIDTQNDSPINCDVA